MIFCLLGDLEVRDPTGAPIELPRGHDLAVLAALLVRPNRQVSRAELLRAGWGDTRVSVAQLHKSVSALRKLLTATGRPDTIKTHNRFGYGVQVADDDLDMLAFNRLVERAEAAKAARRAADEIACLRRALRLWRGPQPLANLPAEVFADVTETLRARRKRIAVRLFSLENSRGAHAVILDDLRQFVAEDPADGELCRQLMSALYIGGHGLDAIVAYERHVEALDRATGGRPATSLRRLHYAMVNDQRDAVIQALGGAAQSDAVPAPVPRQLPAAPGDFVGRSDALAEVVRLLREPAQPVLVISGPGGIGKTALALRAARDVAGSYPDGQLWAELRGTGDRPAGAAEVLAPFLRALGVASVPETVDERAALFRSLLADRRVLVVLDDAATGAQIRDLIPGGPRCAVLVTARRRLPDVPGGGRHVAPLEPLDHHGAAELFRGIVAAAQVDLSGEERDVDEVLRLCGGLPLALRIAASLRVEDYHRPTADLLRRLREQGTAAFAYGDANLSRTLGAGLAPLGDRARRLFLGLGLLTAPTFAEWTAAALLPGGDRALSQLAAAGLIEPVGAGRFRFHDLTREYAHGRAMTELTPAAERVAALERVGRALLTLTRHAHAALYGGDYEVVHSGLADVAVPAEALAEAGRTPMEWFERERLTIRATVEQTAVLDAELCWDLAVSAHELYTLGEYFDDWRATHELALTACRAAGDRRGEGMVLAMLGQPPLVASGSPGVSGVPELETAVGLLAQVGERHGQAIALRTLANALRRRGELVRPLALFTEALDHYEYAGDVVGVLQALRFAGQTHFDLGDSGRALEMFRRAESMAAALDQPRVLAQTRYWIGRACLARDDLAGARTAFGEVLTAFPTGPGVGHAYALHGLGDLDLAAGDLVAARRRLSAAEELADGADVILAGRVALSIAGLEERRRRPADRVVALLRAVERFQSCGAVHLEIEAQASLAAAQALVGDAVAAEAAWDRIDELYFTTALPAADRLVHRPLASS